MRRQRLSVLLVDDHHELLLLYKRQLQRCGPFSLHTAITAEQAKIAAERQLFDVLLIDAKLEYRNTEYGGLRLADELKSRYGTQSILIMSRFVTADWMRLYGGDYGFIDKHGIDDPMSFYKRLAERIQGLWRTQYVLVVMSFGKEPTRIYKEHVKPAVENLGLKCVRADEVEHTRYIPSVVFNLVIASKLVILIADGLNANAFYEAGFADALKKEVVMITKTHSDLPFDVAQRHAIAYGHSEAKLQDQLKKKLTKLRHVMPLGI